MFRPDYTSDDNLETLPSRGSEGEGSTQDSLMSDVSSGHTEIIPSQSSPSDSHWSFDRDDDDDDPRYAEMRSNRSSSSGSVWSNRDEGHADDSLDEESDDRLVEGDDNFDAENGRRQAEDREDENNS
ncbi:hypothetical protein P3T76_008519 [Phytophthora citrophthora]|nr:hypothetical protein P3T76_008519 [Phytophthora citrophthora]